MVSLPIFDSARKIESGQIREVYREHENARGIRFLDLER
jgi:hypothetical protein